MDIAQQIEAWETQCRDMRRQLRSCSQDERKDLFSRTLVAEKHLKRLLELAGGTATPRTNCGAVYLWQHGLVS